MFIRNSVTAMLVLGLFLAVSSPLSAQTGATVNLNATSSSRKAEVKAEVELRKSESEARRVQAQGNASTSVGTSSRSTTTKAEKRADQNESIAKRKALNTYRVITALIGRLEKIADRVQSRIDKVGGSAEAQVNLNAARTHLGQASTTVSVLANIDLSGERLQDNLNSVRTVFRDAKMHLREAHTSLMMSVRVLKSADADDENESDE